MKKFSTMLRFDFVARQANGLTFKMIYYKMILEGVLLKVLGCFFPMALSMGYLLIFCIRFDF